MDEKPSYSYRDPFSPHRKSDVDFKDVFGGPPSRRSSVYERPPLWTDSGDYARSSRGSRDELMHTTRHWSGSGGEKPAFGEGSNSSSGRRRIFGDDFFTDIFPGSDSSSSTPKREVFNSNPGSGVLSPNRPVQAKHEGGSGGGGGGSSLPAQVSLSMKISHDTVSETNSYPSSPNSTTNLKSNIHSQYLRPNSSSRLRSQNSSEIHANTIAQFHFSFYKWAGKGATIKFPKEEEEGRGTGLSVAEIVIQGIDLLSDNEEDKMSVETDLTEESGNNTQGESKFRVKNLAEFLMNEKVKNQENLQMEEEKDSKNSKKSESSISSEDKITGRKVKGKLVREFIKRFKSDKSPKQKIKNENRDQKRRKDSYENQDQNQNQFGNIDSSFSLQDEEKEEKPKSVKMSIDDAFFFASSHMGEEVKENIEAKSEEIRTEQKNKISEPDTNNEAQNNEESHFDDFEACLVEESIEDPNQNNEAEDQIKISESKIRNWSKGKETNIRSLLSTLQYVLWDKSGWKPVPLVDIIEGPAVKKTYQRALLCLHPDKLQQRGAAPHQKYIAEKVFDILQEAWNQFSMMS